jgi:hypothetical protein
VQQAFVRVPHTDHPQNEAWHELSEGEFSETPLYDVLDYLQDEHGIPIAFAGAWDDGREEPISLNYKDIPFFLALAMIAKKGGVDWAAYNNVVVVGPADNVEQYRNLRFRRAVKLARTGVFRDALDEQTRLEFLETPLRDILDFLRDLHSISNIVIVGEIRSGTPVTCYLKDTTLACAFDVMLLPEGLTWDTDGEVIYVGTEEAVDAVMEVAASRVERRSRYPKILAEKLQRRIDVSCIETPMPEFAATIGRLAGLPVELGQMPDELSKKGITVRFDDLRLDALLDILCHEQGIQWRATDRGTIELKQ